MNEKDTEFLNEVKSLLESCKNKIKDAYIKRNGASVRNDEMKLYGVVMALIDSLVSKPLEVQYSFLRDAKDELMSFMKTTNLHIQDTALYNAMSEVPSRNQILENSKLYSEENQKLHNFYLEMYEAGEKLSILPLSEIINLIELIKGYSSEIKDVVVKTDKEDTELTEKAFVLRKLNK